VGEAENEDWKKDLEEIAGFVLQGLDTLNGFFDAISERRLRQFDEQKEAREAEIERLEEQLETAEGAEAESLKRRIKQEEKALKEINKKREEQERKDAIREKTLAVTKSLINTALAVTKALPNLVLAGVIGALGAVQTASIVAQPLADGGVVGEGEGQVVSVSGEKIGNRGLVVQRSSKGDDRLIYANAREVVLNESQQFALGGAETFRAIGVRGFADGGAVVPQAPSVSSGGGILGLIQKVDEKTDAINNRLDRLKVFIVDEDLEENNDERDRRRALTELGG